MKKMIESKVGAAIKGGLWATGITQAELAERIGMSAPTFTSRMHNCENFTVGELSRIGRILGIDFNGIF